MGTFQEFFWTRTAFLSFGFLFPGISLLSEASQAMQFWVSRIALKKLPQANWGWISMCKGTTVLCRGSVELCKGTAELTNVSCGDWTEVVVVVAGSSCVGQMLQRLLQSTCCSTQWIHTKPFWWQKWQWWCNTETTYGCSVFSVLYVTWSWVS